MDNQIQQTIMNKINTVFIHVKDLQKAVDWYADELNLFSFICISKKIYISVIDSLIDKYFLQRPLQDR